MIKPPADLRLSRALLSAEDSPTPPLESFRLRPVLLESPYAGDVALNLRYARACMRHCFLVYSEAAYASHMLYTQEGVLDDDHLLERALGIEGGLVWGTFATRSVVFVDLGISRGMFYGIARAFAQRREIEVRELPAFPTLFGRASQARTMPNVEYMHLVYNKACEAVRKGESKRRPANVLVDYFCDSDAWKLPQP